MNSHVVIKLTNGIEIYGKIDAETKPGALILLEDPLTTEEVVSLDGSYGTVLVKFSVATNENTVAIVSSNIMTIMLMSPTFKEYYDASVELSSTALKSYETRLSDMTEQMKFMLASSDVPNIILTESNTIH